MTDATKLDPIQAALAQANANAAATAAVPALATPASTGVAPAPVKLTMASMMAGGMSVDKWLKVNEDGIKVGDSKLIAAGFVMASIDMTEGSGFILKQGIKGGNPAQYAYTTDGVNATTGGSWEAACQRIRMLDQKASPYRSVDLPFTLTEDALEMGTNAAVGKAGDVVGYTTSTTNWKNWELFYKAVDEAGLMGETVLVKLTSQPRSNKNGNNWGVLQFELMGAAPE